MVSETEEEGPDTEVGDEQERNTADAAFVYPKVADSLASLGFYARSMKPPKAWWHQGTPPLLSSKHR